MFLLSLLVSAALVWLLTRWLAPPGGDRAIERRRLFAPAAGVLLFVGVLYVLRLIPPVPLSVQFHGIYHEVRRESGAYTLVYEEPPAWALWRRDSRPFGRRGGDRLFYFARVFAPSGFRHRVVIRWEVFDPARGAWTTTDRIPIDVVGGRAEGFRGWAVKANFTPGAWRATAETEDGRAIATLPFRVEEDTGTGERQWRTLRARDSGSNVKWTALLARALPGGQRSAAAGDSPCGGDAGGSEAGRVDSGNAAERLDRRAGVERARFDRVGAQLQVGEYRPGVSADVHQSQRLARLADGGEQLQAHCSSDVAADCEDPPARLVHFDHHVAVASRADSHLAPALGDRAIGRAARRA